MVVVKKKNRANSADDLVTALNTFIHLLEGQHEDDAAAALQEASNHIQKSALESREFQDAIRSILDAFDGEHELSAYTIRREKEEDVWTVVEQLYHASVNVLNLARRLQT